MMRRRLVTSRSPEPWQRSARFCRQHPRSGRNRSNLGRRDAPSAFPDTQSHLPAPGLHVSIGTWQRAVGPAPGEFRLKMRSSRTCLNCSSAGRYLCGRIAIIPPVGASGPIVFRSSTRHSICCPPSAKSYSTSKISSSRRPWRLGGQRPRAQHRLWQRGTGSCLATNDRDRVFTMGLKGHKPHHAGAPVRTRPRRRNTLPTLAVTRTLA